jgi:hypothetical protein
MNDKNREFSDGCVEIERARMLTEPGVPSQPTELRPIHYTSLPEDTSGGRCAIEWNTYRRQVARLLAEGHERRWVLLKGEELVGIWDTEAEARAAAVARYLMQPVLIRQILTYEPVLRAPTFLNRWRT